VKFLFGLLLFSAAAFAQDAIPLGTILPVQLNSSLNSQKNRSGQIISGRIMQDVPAASGKRIRAGSKVVGRILSVTSASNGTPAEITLQFDVLKFSHTSAPITTNLRAMASMMEVEDAQVPPTGTDRGTPWAWMTRILIGGEVVYGQGGPVARGDQIVGQALYDGVLLPLRARPGSNCRGETAGNNRLQALWVFSSDACGVYGMEHVEIKHAGRTAPLGEISLTSKQGNVNIRSGSGMLLRVIAAGPHDK